MWAINSSSVTMKKISRDRQLKIERIGKARWRNALVRESKRYSPNKFSHVHSVLGTSYIMAPANISIYDLDAKQSEYIKTISFLNNIERVIGSGRRCVIDFTETDRITAAALVLVYARIEISNKQHKRKIGIAWSQKSKRVNSIIRTSNLYKLINNHEFKYSLDSNRQMPIISSVGSSHMEDIIDYIQKRVYEDKMPPEVEHIYGDAVSETINNVGLHAYPDLPNEEKRWWLMCETYGKKLYLAIYDKGVGIPKTVVNRSWFWGRLSKVDPDLYTSLQASFPNEIEAGLTFWVPQQIPDEKLIFLSMQGDVSGTKKDKHGQGSKSIMALVSDTSDGLLWVFSNFGVYTFNQEGQTPGLAKLNQKFPGTLVQWNIELP